ncbi:type II toxin-antitoxin system VapC family toxin [Sulfuriferula nivalis]|uniref:Twitching motility protein PilT n=1 Tax=Sulfuriferula nivalis TaxID=2675298 RepID=A0A809SB73_9PROT|nr:PIN domain-containing protein [Sulfuriferula nivalis]BBP02523.1 twitching motility protein PilT [Sulfuriferula nivalis]
MNVLIDTSVWIDHFRNGNDVLVNIIELDRAFTHPMVILELACGTPPAPRIKTLNNISFLQSCNQVSLGEVMQFIEHEKLYGLGCGLVDITLLASTLITPSTELWTLDKRLADLAVRFGVAFEPMLH